MGGNQFSPAPDAIEEAQVLLSFSDAIAALIKGSRIRRVAWVNQDEYGILVDGWLSIHINGSFSVWKVSDGDLLANDWIVV